MAKQATIISVEGIEVRFYKESDDDFISLTDIAKRFNERTGQLIFNSNGFVRIKNQIKISIY